MKRLAPILVLLALMILLAIPYKASSREERHPLPTWVHLSTKTQDLPIPFTGNQQTAALVFDVDHDGHKNFVLSERTQAPSVVWYRRAGNTWEKYVIENSPLHVEAGGAFYDIDGDGDLDLVLGGDWMTNEMWWWENPYPNYDHQVPWKRHIIKKSGATQHHDQLMADFDGCGKPELVFWNQGDNSLYLARIPADPRHTEPWPMQVIYKSPAKAEGLAATDVDGDGKLDIVGGGGWLKNEGGLKFTYYPIDEKMRDARAAVGRFKPGPRPQVVFVIGDGVSRLKWYEWANHQWQAHDLLGADVIHGHSLQVADIDGDGNLDIFCAEMGKWSDQNAALKADNPNAKMWVFYGDGKGNFTKTVIAEGIANHESKVADLDGDGRLDILDKPYNWDTPRIDIWLNKHK